jgi:hypothetical protein
MRAQAAVSGSIIWKWSTPGRLSRVASGPAAAAYRSLSSRGTSVSAVPCTTSCGTPSGTSAAGSAWRYTSGRSSGPPPSNLDTALSLSPSRAAMAISQTPASDTTSAGTTRTADAPTDRLAAHSASCPPAECPIRPTLARSTAPSPRSATASSAAATSSNVPGQPPPGMSIRRYSMFHTA